jgi:multiple antibiotic resistance protein
MGIKLGSFKIGGAIILLILGIQGVLGLEFTKKEKRHKVAAIIIGTPLLSGPAAITTAILLEAQYGYLVPLVASAMVLCVTWFMLVNSDYITKRVGDEFIEIASRVLGLLLAALAVQYIADGIILLKNTV